MEAKLGIEQKRQAPENAEGELPGVGENNGQDDYRQVLGEVVLGLIESGGGRASVKEIIYALTLKTSKVEDDRFKDILFELRALSKAKKITRGKNSKYYPFGKIIEDDAEDTSFRNDQPRTQPKRNKRKSLDYLLHEAFGGRRYSQFGRRRQANPRRRNSRSNSSKKHL